MNKLIGICGTDRLYLPRSIRLDFVRSSFHHLRRFFRPTPEPANCALVLSGGGARSAYQVGVLQYIAAAFPDAQFPIIQGVSAGAINAAHLANDCSPFPEAVDNLIECWSSLRTENVFQSESSARFLWNLIRSGKESDGDSDIHESPSKALLDTSPLRTFLTEKFQTPDGRLTGIAEKIESGALKAVTLITTSYSTGQTVSWIEGCDIKTWDRPNRVAIKTRLTIEHVMASASLPFLFPAVRIGDAWYGDGGIRLSAPLAPSVHLGANRVLAIATRYDRTQIEADEPATLGYPPGAQLLGLLMDAIFLDTLDQDAMMIERINRLLEQLPRRKRGGLRPIKFLLLRPSIDLGKLSGEYEPQLHGPLGLLSRGLSSDKTKSPDWLSMLLFDPEYTIRLMEIGYEDAHKQHSKIEAFLGPEPYALAANG